YRLALDPAALPGAIDEDRELLEGFAVQAFDPRDDEQAERWVRVNAAAFASHPEQGAVTLEDFAATTREAWFDPEDLLLAFDTGATTSSGERRSSGADDEDDDRRHGRLAGYTWIKTIRTPGHTETELYVLGVDPAYAGRGLGAALLGETLRRMAAHAPDRITLYVDGDNGTARGLYDRAGFTVDQRSTQWLRAGGDAGIGAGGDEPGRQDRTGA
ncbi:GNAT family N-acetyltransferase, partial [Leucobacter soli]|uniref:GNAT family N-acetyltransferase n=1 Tax=Leucobacter soli TaxID=2812850 RepID=UPI0036096D8A